jgi:hypothetical protein
VITFRYHIVTLVSVFLALAIGIALGGGPLKGEVDNSLVKELAARKKTEKEQRVTIRELRAAAAFSDGFAKATAPTVLSGTLKGVSVAVVSLPEARQTTVTELQSLVRTAGARLVGSYRVGDKLGDDTNKGLVDQLGTQMMAGVHDVQVPSDASTYQRFGLLLGRAIGTKDKGNQPFDATSTSLVSGFATAGLVSAVGTPKGRARVVIMVTGPGGTSARQAGVNEIHAVVADAMTDDVSAVVLSGPADAARAGGLLRKVRDDVNLSSVLSTVDSAGTGSGAVVTLLAAAQDLSGGTGQYGAVDAADGPVPGSATG